MTGVVRPGPVDESELPALRELARDCLAADGGLPLFATEPLLRARLLAGTAIAGRDEQDRIVAVAGLSGESELTTCGLVHPSRRGEGLGRLLLGWAVREAADRPLTVVTETWSPGADRLYAHHGLVEVFAERVLRHALVEVPEVPVPLGVHLVPVSAVPAAQRFAAYVGSFADRPGFRAPTAQEWLGDLDEDEDFRPDVSVVACADGEPVGFVHLVGDFIDQVGVVPTWRGRGLGAHLVTHGLRALRDAGLPAAWLSVNVDNPAAGLYERLGFEDAGRRARYSAPPS